MNLGDTFRSRYDNHLWMVISDPSMNPDAVVTVMFTTWTERQDQACIIEPGEHPFVKHRTVICYACARITRRGRLDELVSTGELVTDNPLSATLLTKIYASAADSEFITIAAWEILREQGLV